jgi:hypothetical protein
MKNRTEHRETMKSKKEEKE